jgi:hypothetical protein
VSQYPSRHPYPRPDQQTAPSDPEGDRAFASEWLGHLAAGRVGVRLEASEEVRAIHAANELIICGDGRLPIW